MEIKALKAKDFYSVGSSESDWSYSFSYDSDIDDMGYVKNCKLTILRSRDKRDANGNRIPIVDTTQGIHGSYERETEIFSVIPGLKGSDIMRFGDLLNKFGGRISVNESAVRTAYLASARDV